MGGEFIYAIAMIVVSLIISAVTASMAKHPDPMKAPLFTDFKFPVPDEGTPHTVIFGDCWSTDWQVLWVGNYKTTAITQSSGGKK